MRRWKVALVAVGAAEAVADDDAAESLLISLSAVVDEVVGTLRSGSTLGECVAMRRS